MSRHDKHIDDLFKDELGSYTETPPPAVWDALEKRLDGNSGKRFPIAGWFVSLLVLCGVALLGVSIFSKPVNIVAKKDVVILKNEKAADQKNTATSVAANDANTHISSNDNSRTAVAKKHRSARVKNNAPIAIAPKENIVANDNSVSDDKTLPVSTEKAAAVISSPAKAPIIVGPDVEKKSKKHNIVIVQSEPQIAAPEQAEKINSTATEPALAINNKNVKQATVNSSKNITNNTTVTTTSQKRNVPGSNVPLVAKKENRAATNTEPKLAVNSKTITTPQQPKTIKKVAAKKTVTTVVKSKPNVINAALPVATNQSQKKKHSTHTADKKKLPVAAQPTVDTTATKYAASVNLKKVSKHAPKKEIASDAAKHVASMQHQKTKPTSAKAIVSPKDTSNAITAKKAKHHQKQLAAKTTQPQKPIATLQLPVTNNTYSGSLYQPASASVAKQDTHPAYINAKETILSSPASKPVDTAKQPTPVQDSAIIAAKPTFKHFEVGIKAGYEGGVSSGAANKIVLSPYIQYRLSPRLSIMTQPAIKEAYVGDHNLSGTRSFYNVTDSSITTQGYAVHDTASGTYGIIGTYVYTQKRDSIVKSYTTSGKYTEFEIPIMLKFSITNNLSVYGGGTMSISRYATITEHTYTAHLTTSVDSPNSPIFIPNGAPPPALSTFSSVISTHGTPFSSYGGPLYPSPQGTLVHFGYMLGFSYEWKKRFLADVLIQQSGAKSNVQRGYDVNKPFSLPYFRITFGYKLSK